MVEVFRLSTSVILGHRHQLIDLTVEWCLRVNVNILFSYRVLINFSSQSWDDDDIVLFLIKICKPNHLNCKSKDHWNYWIKWYTSISISYFIYLYATRIMFILINFLYIFSMDAYIKCHSRDYLLYNYFINQTEYYNVS